MTTSTINDRLSLTLDQMEELLDQYKRDKKAFEKEIQKPQMEVAKYRKAIKTANDQIDKLQDLQRMAMGDQEQIDTSFYRFRLGHVNPSSSRNWELERDKEATPKQLAEVFAQFDSSLIKTAQSVNEPEIKNRLADGTYRLTTSGQIVNPDGEALPGYSGALKRPTVTVKAKEV